MDKTAYMLGYMTKLEKAAAAVAGANLGYTPDQTKNTYAAAKQSEQNYFKPAATVNTTGTGTDTKTTNWKAPENDPTAPKPAAYTSAGMNFSDPYSQTIGGGKTTNTTKAGTVANSQSGIQENVGDQWYEGKYGKVRMSKGPTPGYGVAGGQVGPALPAPGNVGVAKSMVGPSNEPSVGGFRAMQEQQAQAPQQVGTKGLYASGYRDPQQLPPGQKLNQVQAEADKQTSQAQQQGQNWMGWQSLNKLFGQT